MNHAVLIVDDERNVVEGIKRVLRKEPYSLVTAHSARDAIKVLHSQRVSVVVTDEKMPVMSGLSLLAYVKKEFPSVTRILFTGKRDVDLAMRAINEAQVSSFISKPVNEIELALAIRNGLQKNEEASGGGRMAEIVRMQASYIEHLEKEHPGISAVTKDETGAIVVDSIESLCSAIKTIDDDF